MIHFEEKLFSVVIPAYGGKEMWKAAVYSVLTQNYPWIELVFSDDGTPGFDIDEVRAFIEAHKKDNLIRYSVIKQKENVGTVRNLRNAHEQCTGHFLTHIAMDDVYCNAEVLSCYASALESKAKDALGIYARSLVCDELLEPLGYVSFDTNRALQMNGFSAKEQYAELTKSCCIHMGATAFLREEFIEAGDFDKDYRLIEDWPFYLKATQSGKRFLYQDFDAIFYRNGGVTDAAYNTLPKKTCCADHIRLYERIILPNLHLLNWKNRIRVCKKYTEDRIIIEREYGPMAQPNAAINAVYTLMHIPAYIKGRKKLFILWLSGILVLYILGAGIAAMLLYSVALLALRKMRRRVKSMQRNERKTG